MRLALLNPNTNTLTTELMLAAARRAAPPGVAVEGRTLAQGAPLIADPQALAQAADGVVAAAPGLMAEGFDGLIVAGFGDPGLDRLRLRWGQAVTGLGEAGIVAAAQGGRRYAIVTVTPALHDSLVALAHASAPPEQFVGVRYTPGNAEALLQSPEALFDALWIACREAVEQDGAESLVIGGGPLAGAADELSQRLAVRVVNPVGAAVRLVSSRLGLPV